MNFEVEVFERSFVAQSSSPEPLLLYFTVYPMVERLCSCPEKSLYSKVGESPGFKDSAVAYLPEKSDRLANPWGNNISTSDILARVESHILHGGCM